MTFLRKLQLATLAGVMMGTVSAPVHAAPPPSKAAAPAPAPAPAPAQMTDKVIKIGVLNDQSGLYADMSGQSSVLAARMAVEDFGGKVGISGDRPCAGRSYWPRP